MATLSKAFMQEHGLHEKGGRVVGKNPITGRVGLIDMQTARQLERIERGERRLAERIADDYLNAGVMSRQLMAYKRQKKRGWHKHPELHSIAARRGWIDRRKRLGR